MVRVGLLQGLHLSRDLKTRDLAHQLWAEVAAFEAEGMRSVVGSARAGLGRIPGVRPLPLRGLSTWFPFLHPGVSEVSV